MIKKPKPKEPYEKDIQHEILVYLKSNGIFHYKAIMSSRMGIPDIIACVNGKFVALEVKRSAKATVHPMQYVIGEEIKKAGGAAHIVWSVEQVQEIIEGHAKKRKRKTKSVK